MTWEVHDGGRVGRYGIDGPTVCRMNPDGTCQPLFQIVGPADPAECRRVLDLAAAAPDLLAALRLVKSQGFNDYEVDGTSVSYTVDAAIRKAAQPPEAP